jgi:hypothetical protein
MRKLTSFVAALALLVGIASVAEAQARQGGVGLMLGLGATYEPSFDITATFEGESDVLEMDSGFGVAARAGFAFTPAFVVFGAYEQSWHDDDVTGRKIFGGLRLNLPVAPSLSPYVSGGYGQRRYRGDDEGVNAEIRGNFFDVGAGIQVYMMPSLALDVGANYAWGEFNTFSFGGVSVDIDSDNAASYRLRAGLTWTPMTGR